MTEKELIAKIKTFNKIQPSQEWLVFCRENLLKNISLQQSENSSPITVRELFSEKGWGEILSFWFQKWQFAGIAAVIILIIGIGGGMVMAKTAVKSLPGDILYPVKIALEKTRIVLTPFEKQRDKLQTELVERRIHELEIVEKSYPQKDGAVQKVKKEVISNISRDIENTQRKIENIKLQISQKDSADKKLPINIENLSQEAEKAIKQAKENLESNQLNAALETSKAAEEIIKGAEAAVEIIRIQEFPEPKELPSSTAPIIK